MDREIAVKVADALLDTLDSEGYTLKLNKRSSVRITYGGVQDGEAIFRFYVRAKVYKVDKNKK